MHFDRSSIAITSNFSSDVGDICRSTQLLSLTSADVTSQVMVRQEVWRKMGHAVQADEEQLKVQLMELQVELNAPTQFKVSQCAPTQFKVSQCAPTQFKVSQCAATQFKVSQCQLGCSPQRYHNVIA